MINHTIGNDKTTWTSIDQVICFKPKSPSSFPSLNRAMHCLIMAGVIITDCLSLFKDFSMTSQI